MLFSLDLIFVPAVLYNDLLMQHKQQKLPTRMCSVSIFYVQFLSYHENNNRYFFFPFLNDGCHIGHVGIPKTTVTNAQYIGFCSELKFHWQLIIFLLKFHKLTHTNISAALYLLFYEVHELTIFILFYMGSMLYNYI